MSYTPKSWGTGDTIYASDMNRIENGVANANNTIGFDGIVYFPNSNVGYQIDGDFANALAKAQQGLPVVVYEAVYQSSSTNTCTYLSRNFPVWYETSHPDRLDIRITGGVGWYWTANGVEYYD